MKQKRHTTDQIISKLRRADQELGQGKKVAEVCRILEKWNFTKFLVNREGKPIKRFAPQTEPEKLEPFIEAEVKNILL